MSIKQVRSKVLRIKPPFTVFSMRRKWRCSTGTDKDIQLEWQNLRNRTDLAPRYGHHNLTNISLFPNVTASDVFSYMKISELLRKWRRKVISKE